MAAKQLIMPDGSEENAEDVICEDCDKPVSQHACATSGSTTSGGGGVVVSRSTGKRKDPKARPQCPHCGGAVHFSMPGGLQNVECIMRQYYLDQDVIAEPNARLPLYGLEDLAIAVTWAKDLKTPITYGRMDSAAGGAGTYAALRPKAGAGTSKEEPGKRPRKQKAAAAGERIEDVAKEVTPATATNGTTAPLGGSGNRKPGRKPKLQTTEINGDGLKEPAVVQSAAPEVDAAEAARLKEERRAQRRALLGAGR